MSRRHNFRIALAALVAFAALAGLAGDSTCVHAQSPSCRSACLAEYNQCRLNTKGALACDSQYRACLQGCVVQR